jgi:RHS repeat-associated protein
LACPAARQWVTPDPLGFAAGQANLAQFVGNAPLDAADPSGLVTWVGAAGMC